MESRIEILSSVAQPEKLSVTLLSAIGAACIALSAAPAAAITIFTDEASFVSAAAPTGFESFEANTVTGVGAVNIVATADFTVTTLVNDLGVLGGPGAGMYATDGDQYLSWETFGAADVITFTFATPQLAFGVLLTDPLDGGASPALSLWTDTGEVVAGFLTGVLPNSSEHFIGITTGTPFTSVSFESTVYDKIGFDSVRFAPIPEPGTALLLGVGLTGLAVRRRRK